MKQVVSCKTTHRCLDFRIILWNYGTW